MARFIGYSTPAFAMSVLVLMAAPARAQPGTPAAQPGPLVNRVNAFGRELDPVPGNNVASASTATQ